MCAAEDFLLFVAKTSRNFINFFYKQKSTINKIINTPKKHNNNKNKFNNKI